jgi:hypothetical protein
MRPYTHQRATNISWGLLHKNMNSASFSTAVVCSKSKDMYADKNGYSEQPNKTATIK